MRVAVIGDIGGHVDELRAELARLGVKRDGLLPSDLLVIQVGDLVHRGPASDDVITLVDSYLRNEPHRWIQLVGNHEANYLRTPAFPWSERLRRRSNRILRRWWRNGYAVVATAVRTADESFLVTHAGLTAPVWSDVLGSPSTAEEAAQCINELAFTGEAAVFRGGCVLGGRVNLSAGPLWADCANELVPSWMGRRMPFSQIYGHTTVTDWRRPGRRRAPALDDIVTVDPDAKHETVRLRGGRLIGIDPGHLDTPTTPWHALELVGATAPSVR
jgi:hypothetical protein